MTLGSVPSATYRLQFTPDFQLADAARLIPYLARLGISHVYASPLLTARRGSSHGYDVVDPATIDPQRGGAAGLRVLVRALQRYGLGLLLDIVPNHMAVGGANAWWMDVLEYGPASRYARFFDINWAVPQPGSGRSGQVLLPILGDRYGDVLERGELRLQLDAGAVVLRYFDHVFPVTPASYGVILEQARRCLPRGRGSAELATVLGRCAARLRRTLTATTGRKAALRPLDEIKHAVADLCQRHARARRAVVAALRDINGRPGAAPSFAQLHALLEQQHYRLAWWQTAPHLINYRRFFDINELIGLRVEQRAVFEAVHEHVLALAGEGAVAGLRIDHIDGLRDPRAYLRTLSRACRRADQPAPYIVVEKILAADEALPAEWQTAGTTGYDFLNAVNGALIDERGLRRLRSLYARLTGDRRSLADHTYALQKDVMAQLFRAPIRALSRQLARLAAADRHGRDLVPSELRAALVELTACLPVYRTYVDERGPTTADRRHIEHAAAEALRRAANRRILTAALRFLCRVALLDTEVPATRRAWTLFVRDWQQFTGAVAAKGVEDTAFYRFHPLVSLNAVGADPEKLTAFTGVQRFHARLVQRQQRWPATMNTTSTHDTKRSADVRARINVLSELPELWERHLLRWRRFNAAARTMIDGAPVPDANEEIFIYQNLLGVWPLDPAEVPALRARFEQFVIKAGRESKLHTSWTRPHAAHEAALVGFVRKLLSRSPRNRFRPDFLRFQGVVAYFGALNALAQALIKLTAPGVPDVYQGEELWDFSLVDPDNRRPVDFKRRDAALRGIDAAEPNERAAFLTALRRDWRDGRIKLYVTQQALRMRRTHQALFERGTYVPLAVRGRRAAHVLAFARRLADQWVLTVVPRCLARVNARSQRLLGRLDWADTAVILPRGCPRQWRDVLSGVTGESAAAQNRQRALPLGPLFSRFPLLLLTSERDK